MGIQQLSHFSISYAGFMYFGTQFPCEDLTCNIIHRDTQGPHTATITHVTYRYICNFFTLVDGVVREFGFNHAAH